MRDKERYLNAQINQNNNKGASLDREWSNLEAEKDKLKRKDHELWRKNYDIEMEISEKVAQGIAEKVEEKMPNTYQGWFFGMIVSLFVAGTTPRMVEDFKKLWSYLAFFWKMFVSQGKEVLTILDTGDVFLFLGSGLLYLVFFGSFVLLFYVLMKLLWKSLAKRFNLSLKFTYFISCSLVVIAIFSNYIPSWMNVFIFMILSWLVVMWVHDYVEHYTRLDRQGRRRANQDIINVLGFIMFIILFKFILFMFMEV